MTCQRQHSCIDRKKEHSFRGFRRFMEEKAGEGLDMRMEEREEEGERRKCNGRSGWSGGVVEEGG